MALVIDRLLLLIFFLAMTIASLVILTSSPHLQVDIIFFSSKQHSTFFRTTVHNLGRVVWYINIRRPCFPIVQIQHWHLWCVEVPVTLHCWTVFKEWTSSLHDNHTLTWTWPLCPCVNVVNRTQNAPQALGLGQSTTSKKCISICLVALLTLCSECLCCIYWEALCGGCLPN